MIIVHFQIFDFTVLQNDETRTCCFKAIFSREELIKRIRKLMQTIQNHKLRPPLTSPYFQFASFFWNSDIELAQYTETASCFILLVARRSSSVGRTLRHYLLSVELEHTKRQQSRSPNEAPELQLLLYIQSVSHAVSVSRISEVFLFNPRFCLISRHSPTKIYFSFWLSVVFLS